MRQGLRGSSSNQVVGTCITLAAGYFALALVSGSRSDPVLFGFLQMM